MKALKDYPKALRRRNLDHATGDCRRTIASEPNSGFALVIALSLMSFIVLLFLSLATLVSVENGVSKTSQDQLSARLNAELGAMIALGELQKLAGPDQRVTARSDILIPPLSNSVEGQGLWTGVWSSKENTSDTFDVAVELHNRQARWLVSGEILDAYSSATNTIKLASVDNSVANTLLEVSVPKVAVTNASGTEQGEYAYWISDEGIKARVNLDDPHRNGTSDDEQYYQLALPQQGDPSAAKDSSDERPFLTNEISLWKAGGTPVDQITNYNELPLVLNNADNSLSREFFHDFTTNSNSLLTNVRDGGFKRDLSTALLDPITAGLTGPMFDPVGDGDDGSGDPGGPKWEQLADHYQYAQSASNNGFVNFRMPMDDQIGITPIVTRFNFIVQVLADDPLPLTYSELASDYSYTVGIFPLITLWNPYDEDLVIPDLGLKTDLRGIYIYNRQDSSFTNLLQLFQDSDMDHAGRDDENRFMVGFTIQGTTIPAGRAINFTPPVNSFIDFRDATQNMLKAGSSDFLNGFFSPIESMPATPGVNLRQYGIGDDDGLGVQICMATSSTNWNRQIINLYSESESNADDMNLENCFLSIDAGAHWPGDKPHPWFGTRVIRIEDAFGDPAANLNFIMNQGDSVSADRSEDDAIDIGEIVNYATTIYGTSAVMAFANTENISTLNKDVHLLSQMNPRSPLIHDQLHARGGDSHPYRYRLYSGGAYGYLDNNNTFLNYKDGIDDLYSYIGMANNSGDGSDKMVLFESPTRPTLGIGQLMHANLMHVDRIGSFWNSNHQQPHTSPAYAIGNSFANIHLPLDQTKMLLSNNSGIFDGSITGSEAAHYDYSYELNNTLWDEFFFSTILPDNVTDIQFPLPNGRIQKWNESAEDADLTDETQTASHLVLQGGFNINSTSIAAWETVLGALRDIDTLGEDPSTPELNHNFSRFTSPALAPSNIIPTYEDGADRDEIVAGYRQLTDEQISSLAQKIVDEIRTRRSVNGHPFLSLSDFINRSIDTDDINSPDRKRFAYTGPLQFAIDQSGINGTPALTETWENQSGDGLWEGNYITDSIPTNVSPYYSESLEVIKNRPFIESAPGALTQADILAKIGAIITPRSDTFTIRSFGNYLNPLTGDEEAKAHYEMIVQRIPEYLDETSNENYDPVNQASALNQRFGRKFKVVSTRWVNNEEI